MTGKTHIAAGMLASAVLLRPHSPVPFAVAAVFSAAGAICPDIDHTESRLHRAVSNFILAATMLIFIFLIGQNSFGLEVPWKTLTFGLSQRQLTGLAGFLMLGVFGYGQPHRGFTHSFTAFLAFTYALWSVDEFASLAFGAGYMTHILLDCLNRKGLQLFWPSGKRWAIGACSANGKFDEALFALCGIAFAAFGAWSAGEETIRMISLLLGR